MAPTAETLLRQAEHAAASLGAMTAAGGRQLSHVRGTHGRRRAGEGDSFWQFRAYSASDAASAVDWRRSARSDTLYVREREWEAAQNLYFWCDASPSMAFASRPDRPTKAARARLIALALACVFARGGERVGLLGDAAKPRAGRFGLVRLAEMLATQEGAPARPAPPILPAGSHVVVLSDFLDPLEDTAPFVRALAGRGIAGHLLRVLDPAEEDFPYHGRLVFEGLEGEAPETLERAQALGGVYRARLAALGEALITLTRTLGWSFTTHRTDHGVAPALLAAASQIAGRPFAPSPAPAPSC
ncbi:MAG: DUF58 domain-containing protein [Pseudomonadota bacterium]